jgi:hypothetical protein
MALAVVRLRASGMETTSTGAEPRRRLRRCARSTSCCGWFASCVRPHLERAGPSRPKSYAGGRRAAIFAYLGFENRCFASRTTIGDIINVTEARGRVIVPAGIPDPRTIPFKKFDVERCNYVFQNSPRGVWLSELFFVVVADLPTDRKHRAVLLKPTNRLCIHVVGPGNVSLRLAIGPPRQCFLPASGAVSACGGGPHLVIASWQQALECSAL